MEILDVYTAFRKAQAEHYARPYRLPKDFEYYFNVKVSPKNREYIQKAALYFSTRWRNINIDRYMRYGFELFGKRFTYAKFFDPRLLKFYIAKDKNEKREIKINKKTIIESAKYVKRYLKPLFSPDSVTPPLIQYCRLTDGYQSVPVKHYIEGHIDKYFLVWLLKTGVLRMTDEDRSQTPYIAENYRDYLLTVNELEPFFTRILASINKKEDYVNKDKEDGLSDI